MSPKSDPGQLARIRELLQSQESFPIEYMHKLIGRNSPKVIQALDELEARFPKLERRSTRMSAGDAHVAVTYVMAAQSADEVIAVIEATQSLEDVLVIL